MFTVEVMGVEKRERRGSGKVRIESERCKMHGRKSSLPWLPTLGGEDKGSVFFWPLIIVRWLFDTAGRVFCLGFPTVRTPYGTYF